jgi:hypothetical protein
VEIHTAEPLVPDPSPFVVEIAIAELKGYKSPGTDQILAELIQAGSDTLFSEIHNLLNFVWNKEAFLSSGRSLSVPTYKKGDKTDRSNYQGISLLSASYKILSNISS